MRKFRGIVGPGKSLELPTNSEHNSREAKYPMSNIQQKLNENRNKIRRDKLISSLDRKFADFLSTAEYSGEISCIKYAAFPRLDEINNVVTTSRGKITNWNSFNFKTWQELVTALRRFQKVKNYIGWFFIESDGPYFKMSLIAFFSHIQEISDFGIQNGLYNFGWVGDVNDVGIIVGNNPVATSDKKFNISIWGM